MQAVYAMVALFAKQAALRTYRRRKPRCSEEEAWAYASTHYQQPIFTKRAIRALDLLRRRGRMPL